MCFGACARPQANTASSTIAEVYGADERGTANALEFSKLGDVVQVRASVINIRYDLAILRKQE